MLNILEKIQILIKNSQSGKKGSYQENIGKNLKNKRYGEILTVTQENDRKLQRIVTKFSNIFQNHTKIVQMCAKLFKIKQDLAKSGNFLQNLAKACKFWQISAKSGNILQN